VVTKKGLRVADPRKHLPETIERLESYGSPNHGNKRNPVDEVVYLILSKQTNDSKYVSAYNALKAEGGWTRVAEAPASYIARRVRPSGLEWQKARQIKAFLTRVRQDQGRLSLSWLRRASDDEALKYLISLPGIGIKTAYCVLMYSLGRDVLPVDTHVFRISARLGLIKPDITLQRAHLELNQLIPKGKRYSYHVNCICHGREVCRDKRPKCSECVLLQFCRYGQERVGKARIAVGVRFS
jgi:endonuclease III